MTDAPNINDIYRRYAELLRRHHHLLAQSRVDDEIESVENQMTSVWNDLDSIQQRSLSGLSSDLNWLRRGGQLALRAKQPAQVADENLRELAEARYGRDWHKLLHLLRLCSARLPTFEVAFLRATAWQALAFPQIASMFSELAAQLDPSNVRLAVLSLALKPETNAADRVASPE